MKPKFFLLGKTLMGELLFVVDAAFAQIWTQTSVPSTNWSSIASSADGTRLVAVGSGGVYISPDSGATWTPTSAPTTHRVNWASWGGLASCYVKPSEKTL